MQVDLSMVLRDRGVLQSLNRRRMLEETESKETRWTETMQELNNKCKTKISNNKDMDSSSTLNPRENIMMRICKEECHTQNQVATRVAKLLTAAVLQGIVNKVDSMETQWIIAITNKDNKINITSNNNKDSNHSINPSNNQLKRRTTNNLKGKATTTSAAGASNTQFTLKTTSSAKISTVQVTLRDKLLSLNKLLPKAHQRCKAVGPMQQIILE